MDESTIVQTVGTVAVCWVLILVFMSLIREDRDG